MDGFFNGFGPIGLFFRTERRDAPTKVFAEEGDELEAGDLIKRSTCSFIVQRQTRISSSQAL
jgi:hypothetical protein